VGTKYDWGAIVGLGIKYGLRAFSKVSRLDRFFALFNIFQNRYRFFCSELVCAAYFKTSSLKAYLFEGKRAVSCSTVTPRDIKKADSVKVITGNDKE
jgi:hypothetical protein